MRYIPSETYPRVVFNPKEMIILSGENKAPTFKNVKFLDGRIFYVNIFPEFDVWINRLLSPEGDHIKFVFIDSWTIMTELLMYHIEHVDMKKYPQNYGELSKRLPDIMRKITRLAQTKFVVMSAIDETIETENGTKKSIIRVDGKKNSGLDIPRYFTNVFWTKVLGNNIPKQDRYKFVTENNGFNTAKSGDGWYEPEEPNDLSLIFGKWASVYDIADLSTWTMGFPITALVGMSGTGKTHSMWNLIDTE